MLVIFASIAKSFDIARQPFVTSMAIIASNMGAMMTQLMLAKAIQDLGLECYQFPL
ncbi:hypothetical protein [Streptococcus jiangjianxini]|uniref:hypothetical protein n=1 Tax=Streptococcus jiangjianxini TaxID=3161189 RepID=UPI0032EAD45E